MVNFEKSGASLQLSSFIVLFLLLSKVAAELPPAKSVSQYDIPYLEQSVQLDGQLEENVWQNALKIPLYYEVSPAENIQAPVVTNAYLFEDGENLWIAFVAMDPEPDKIRAFLSDRDDINASDLVRVTLDTFKDARRAFQFDVNPLGIQADRLIDESDSSEDLSWDSIWQSVGKINDSGYVVEIKLPFKALRFEGQSGEKTWGIELSRVWPRQLTHMLSNQKRDRNIGCVLCQMSEVNGFKGINRAKNVTMTPSLTALKSEQREPVRSSPWQGAGNDEKLSLDLRWGFSQEAFINATINPDFSQVEADGFQLDVNNVSVLSLDEKRPFFVDGKDYFNHWNKLIYTRIFEEPELGLKFTAKQNNHSHGAIAVKDKHTNFLLPFSEGSYYVARENEESNNFIYRYRYDLEENSSLGTTFTYRSGTDYLNQVVGIDGKYWFGDTDYLKFESFYSKSEYPVEIVDTYRAIHQSEFSSRIPVIKPEMSGSALSAHYQHLERDWEWSATYFRFSPDFRADAGFIGFSNWQRAAVSVTRIWYSENPASWWTEWSVFAGRTDTNEVEGGDLMRRNSLNFEVSGIYESTFGIDLRDQEQYFEGQTYSLDTVYYWGEFNPFSFMQISFEYAEADAFVYSTGAPGTTDTLTNEIQFFIGQGFNVQLESIQQEFDLINGRFYEFELYNLKLAYQFNKRNQLRFTLQARTLDLAQLDRPTRKNTGSQLLYSYKVNPFSLVYLGYSDRATDSSQLPYDLERTDRTLFAKFSYAWQL